MISPRRVLVIAVGCALFATSGWTRDVEREPESPIFESLIRPRLTTLEEVLEIDTAKSDELADGGVLVLDEEVRAVSADATSLIAYHRVVKPMTDAGVELASQVVFSYNKSHQRIYLVTARTRQPDGTVTDINGDAAFIQTPQHQADQGIYSDAEELVVLFSNVKVENLVEYVVVVEMIEPRMPGEWGTVILPGAYWPTSRFRSQLIMEEPLAEDLRIVRAGGPLPPTTTPPVRSGWRAWAWSDDDMAPMSSEVNRAPSTQRGPAIRLTTVASWDDLAVWYGELLKSRNSLAPEITNEINIWTEGLTDEHEILEVLHRKVADDVRYTGLEFGIGALRPRPPDEVWFSQYGDCKDKANLLRVMLAQREIDAHMVLLNTIHAGLIDEGTPHYNQFNHAILAVEIDGETVFCDPTLPSSEPGMLTPSDTGRKVLLIHGGQGELISVPSQDAGRLEFRFDIEVGADGGLSGWLEIEADHVRGARLADYFRFLDTQSRQRRFRSLVDAFFEGSELIDVEFPEDDGSAGSDFSVRGFFVVGGIRGQDRTEVVLRFPHGEMVFPYLEDDDDRRTQWSQEIETTVVEIRYHLADGWREQASLPPPLKVSSPAVTGEARWSRDEEGALNATLNYRTQVDLVDQKEFARFRQAVAALRAWMDTPVTVAPTGDARPAERELVEIEMPMMPSGEGQLRLVDRMFPSDGDPNRRRAALLQVQQLFPGSPETIFDVQVWLAQLDAKDGRPEEAAKRIQDVIEVHGDKVTRDSIAWARYHLAHHLLDSGDVDGAAAGFSTLANDADLSDYRRATAFEMLAVLHIDAENEELGIQALDDGLALESGMEAELQDWRARLLVGAGRSDELDERLRSEIEVRPHTAQWTFQSLTTTVSDLVEEGNLADAAALATVLLTIADSSSSIPISDQIHAELEELSQATLAYSEIAAAIVTYLEDDAPDWLKSADTGISTDTLESLDEAMSRFDTEGRFPEYIRCGLDRLARHQTSVDDFGGDLWSLAVVVEARPSHDALLEALIGWGLALPKTDDFFFEFLIVQARWFEQNGEAEKALELLRQWSESPEVDTVYRVAFLARLGLTQENLGDWEGALSAYRQLEPDRDSNLGGYDALLRAVFLNLGLGRHDEALRLIGLLADLDEDSLAYCDSPSQIEELVSLAGNPELAKRFWALERDWMPVWESLERAVGLEPWPAVSVPIIPDVHETGVELGKAINAEAPMAYFEQFRTLVQSARWQPEMVFEVCGLSGQTARMAPEHSDLEQALIVGLASGLDIGDDLIYKRSRLVLATYYFDQNLFPPVVTLGRDYLGRFEPDDAIGQAIVRIWGLAASYSGIDQQPAIERLEKALAEYNVEGSRTVTVYVLAKLYGAQGRTEDEVELIETEIANGITDNQLYGERLERRLQELAEGADGGSGFVAAVEEWFEAFAPPWYDAAAPMSLDDPLATQIERDIEKHSERYEMTELIKYQLLVARDPSRPESEREWAFAFAVSDLESLAVSVTDADAILEALVGDERMPKVVRRFPLWSALDDAFDRSDSRRLDRWMSTSAFKTWVADDREQLQRKRDGLPDPGDDAAAIAVKVAATVARPLDDTGVRILRKEIERLLQLGDFDAVDAIIANLDKASFDTNFESSGAALRLELRRRLSEHRANWPPNEAMRFVVLEELGNTIPDRPQVLDEVADVNHIDHLPREQAFAIRHYLLATRQIDVPSAGFWSSFADDLRDLHSQEISRRALEAGVTAATDDETRSRLLLFVGTSCFDVDDPEDRERLDRLMAPFRENPATPLSQASAVLISGSTAARRGLDFDVTAMNGAAATLELSRGAIRMRLAQARRAGVARLRRELETIPADYLVDPSLIPLVLPSLREVGLDDEADLVAEVGRDEALQNMLRSWSSPQSWALRSTLRLCGVLENESCLPPEWLEFMAQNLGNRELVLGAALTDAELRHDWPAARDAALELVERRPRVYDLYWNLGRAEAHLQNDRAASEALAIFVRYCHDSVYINEGKRLLASLTVAAESESSGSSARQ